MTETQRKRSGCLSTLLIFLIVVYALGALGSFAAAPLLQGTIPGYTTGTGIIMGIMYIVNIIFLVAVWRFKKWGFYGYIAVTIISIIIGLYMQSGIASALMALVFPIMLFFLLRPIWSYLK